jgi:hypothetical protein
MLAQGLNLLVFREGRQLRYGSALKSALAQRLRLLETASHPAGVLSALLQAGELECWIADSGVAGSHFPSITDALAASLIDPTTPPNWKDLLSSLDGVSAPSLMPVSTPEGFAFYGLHPLAFADAVEQFPIYTPRVAVIGIRSIGTTLSAMAAAALRYRGIPAVRATVRPTGHPYNRQAEFCGEELRLVENEVAGGGVFVIVDEGPGLSGSSFLSVAEALVRAGVPREKITLMCAHSPDVDRLCAENAADRWRQFRSLPVPSQPRRPAEAQVWIGAGEWRRYLVHHEPEWPASWLSFERPKYLSGQGPEARFYKFAGFGGYGEAVLQREQKVATAGFGPSPRIETDGYVSYRFIDGRPMRPADLSEGALAQLASYCVFRQSAFAVEATDAAPLQQMADHNLSELGSDVAIQLRVQQAVVPDGRMQPHEWLLTRESRMLKTDSGSHGDDHFFPGATDIAWDLAGAIVEWQMDAAEAEVFLEMYRRASRDDARSRIADYLVAYTAFRRACCTMGANAMQGTQEQTRLERAAAYYGARLLCCSSDGWNANCESTMDRQPEILADQHRSKTV